MNFERLFEECGITAPWELSKSGHQHFETCITSKKDGGSVCHLTSWPTAEQDGLLISKSPEMLKALIEYVRLDEWIGERQLQTPHMAKAERGKIISLIESATGKTWKEIKEILEGKG